MPTLPGGTPAGDQRVFEYDDRAIAALRSAVSPDRLSTYLAHTAGDEVQAFRLYTRNAALASAFLGPLQAVEVTLRNVFHGLLSESHGSDWYDIVALSGDQKRSIASVKRKLRQQHKTLTPSRIVAECSFGFWVSFATRRYATSIWMPTLHRAFSPTPPRKEVFQHLDRLRTLRNRVAHHEPIIFRNLSGDYGRILQLLEWMSPETARWVTHYSRIRETLAKPVAQTTAF